MKMNVKLKRILSLVLSLCMILSWNVPAYAAGGDAQDVNKTYEYTPETCPGHAYTELLEGDEYILTAPSCTEEGIGIYACGKCGYVDEFEGIGPIPALGHDEQVDRVEATCEEDGSITTTCTRCDYRDVQTIPATGQHEFDETQKVEVSAATCTEAKRVGYKCKNCPTFKEDSIESEGTALGHDFNGEDVKVQDATCSAYAKLAKKCTRCDETDPTETNWTEDTAGGYDDTKHNFEGAEDVELEAATCSKAAVWGKKCTLCNTAVDESSKHEVGEAAADAHDTSGVEEVTVSATCAHGNYKYKVCKLCHEKVITVADDGQKDSSKHTWADTLSVIAPATCHQGEVQAKKCTNPECDAYDEASKVVGTELNPENHEWDTQKTFDADCENNARIVKVCKYHSDAEELVKDLYQESVKNGSEDKSLKAKGHTEKILPAVAATCKNPGKTEGKQCLVCGKVIAAQEDVPVDENAHVYPDEADEIFKPETCSKTGLGKYTCTVCGKVTYKVIPARHIYEEVVTKEPTCTEAGEKVMTCNRDGGCTNASADDYTKTEVIPALGHDWGEGAVTTPSTCTEKGVRTYTCANCGETRTADEPMVEHDYQNITIPATCQHPAQKGSACSVCKKVEPNTTPEEITDTTDSDYEAAKPHDYVEDTEQNVAATCTEDGKKVEVCSMCGDKKETPVSATGHTYVQESGADKLTEVPPTCTEAGKWVKHCSVCEKDVELTADELTAAGKTVQPATNHEGTTEERDKIPATCQEIGHEAGTFCTACDQYISGGEEIAVDTTDAGHNWKITPLKAASCTANGVGKYECQNPGCTASKYETIPAAHTWEENGTVTKAATCTEAGEQTFACTKCDETKTEEIEALGHDWNEWQTVTAANCGKAGKKTRTCKRNAEHVEEEEIPATGEHTPVYDVIDADCTNPKRAGSHCSVCGEILSEALVVNDTNKADIIAAYKTAKGLGDDADQYTQDQKDELAVFEAQLTAEDASGHSWPAQGEVTTEATCTTDGAEEFTCTECGEKKTETIEALGHEIEDDYEEATCTTNGKTTPYCTRCDYRGDTVDLGELDPATGHNLQPDNETALKKATCTTTGIGKNVCQNDGCDYSEYGVIPITHTYDEGEVTIEPTCTTDGEKVYTCSVCGEETEGHTKTEVIPATGHKYGAIDFVAATCEAPASVGIKCTACGELKAGATVITAENQAKLLSDLKTALELDDVEDADAIAELTDKVKPAAATGHDWEQDSSIEPTSTTPATCYAAGKKVYTCELCKKETEVEIPKREHDFKETYHDADCEHAGYMEITCTYDDCEYHEEDHDSFADIDPALGHDMEDVAQEDATCVAPGHASGQRCTRCDHVIGCEEIDPDTVNGHVWDEGVEQGEDICTNGGTLVKTCTLCHTATKEETIAPGHKWVRKTIKDEETGKTMAIVKGCDRCGTISEYLYMPKGYGYCPTHGLVEISDEDIIPAVAPICTEAGTTEGKRCPQCPEDAAPIQEPQEVPATGHTYKEDKVIEPAKCNAPGKKAKVCDVCGETYDEEAIPATGIHEYKDVLVDATCQSNAFVKKICTGCGAEDPDWEPLEIAGTMDENAHKYNGTECTVCHKPMPEGYAHCEEHGWVQGVVVTGTAASCTQTGLTDGLKCPICGEVIKEQTEIPMTDHTYTKWVEVTPATCKDAGVEKQVCVDCDHESGETREIPKTDTHDYKETMINGTCVSPDKLVMICQVCGKQGDTVYEGDPETIDPDAHEFVEGVCKYCHKSADTLDGYMECETDGWVKGQVVRGKEPTCKETGLSDGIKCPICQAMLVEQTVLDKTDVHTFGEWVTVTPATCKDAGTKIAKCSICEQQYGETEEIPATGEHSYTVEGLIDGTCSTNAFITFSCSGCGLEDESLRQEVPDSKDPDNHTYERHETAASCTENKTISYVCSGCGQEDPDRPATEEPGTAGHTFGEWIEKKAPTCAEAGTKVAKCSVCGEEYGDPEEIPATGEHSYTVEKTVTEATCTANVIKGYFCATCGAEDESKRVEVPDTAKGHTFGEWIEKKAPTCAEAGTKVAKCSVCGEEYGDPEEIPATGKHSYTVEKTVTEATCTANAVKGYFCATCGAEDESKRVEVPNTAGHVFEGDTCKGCGTKNATAVTTGTGSVISGTNRVTLRSDISVADKDAEIVEMGVLYITAKAYAGDAKSDLSFALAEDGTYTISNSSVRVQKYTSAEYNLADYDNVYITINLGTDAANTTRTLYGRGYIIVKKDGKYSVQFDSNVIKGTYADGFSAM